MLQTSYVDMEAFRDDRAVVQANDPDATGLRPFGFIDREGREVTSPAYPKVRGFSSGMAAVAVGDLSKRNGLH